MRSALTPATLAILATVLAGAFLTSAKTPGETFWKPFTICLHRP